MTFCITRDRNIIAKNLNSSEVSHLQIIALLVDSISQQEKHKWDFYLIKRQQPKK